MCGLAGSITHKKADLKPAQRKIKAKIMRGLLIAMEERGDHSTGIAGIFNDSLRIIKNSQPAETFIESKNIKTLLGQSPNIILGHTRWATIGGISPRNAHPFQYGNIIGCHNGHVSNYQDIFSLHNVKAEVDSEAIFYLLDKHSNDYKSAFPQLRGSFAITWFTKEKPDTVFLARDGNPLFVIHVPELETYFWASTAEALRITVAPFFSIEHKDLFEVLDKHVLEIDTNFNIKSEEIAFKSYYSHSTVRDAQNIEDDDKIADLILKEKTQEIVGSTYFERTGYKNPFLLKETTETLSNSNKLKIASLNIPQMDAILKSINSGCMVCSQPINFIKDYGFFWQLQDSCIICLNCQIALQENWNDIVWIGTKDLDNIYSEVESFANEAYE